VDNLSPGSGRDRHGSGSRSVTSPGQAAASPPEHFTDIEAPGQAAFSPNDPRDGDSPVKVPQYSYKPGVMKEQAQSAVAVSGSGVPVQYPPPWSTAVPSTSRPVDPLARTLPPRTDTSLIKPTDPRLQRTLLPPGGTDASLKPTDPRLQRKLPPLDPRAQLNVSRNTNTTHAGAMARAQRPITSTGGATWAGGVRGANPARPSTIEPFRAVPVLPPEAALEKYFLMHALKWNCVWMDQQVEGETARAYLPWADTGLSPLG
jgi:hypothetical protein